MTIATLDQVQDWLGHPKIDEQLIIECWQSAEAYVDARTDWEPDPGQWWADQVRTHHPEAPEDLRLAVCILTGRYLQRRNTPDGLVGLGEMGAARVPYTDADVERLMNPWRYYPVA